MSYKKELQRRVEELSANMGYLLKHFGIDSFCFSRCLPCGDTLDGRFVSNAAMQRLQEDFERLVTYLKLEKTTSEAKTYYQKKRK